MAEIIVYELKTCFQSLLHIAFTNSSFYSYWTIAGWASSTKCLSNSSLSSFLGLLSPLTDHRYDPLANHRLSGPFYFCLPLLSHNLLYFFLLSASLRKPNVERPGVLKSRKLVQRRRNTCPSPQDISRALQSPSPAPSASAANLDELIQRCLNCFGQSVCLSVRVCIRCLPCAFITTWLYKWGWIMGIQGESDGWRGWGWQRAVSYN